MSSSWNKILGTDPFMKILGSFPYGWHNALQTNYSGVFLQ
jgi:hypothetical protein